MSDLGGEGRDALEREEMGIKLVLFSPVPPPFNCSVFILSVSLNYSLYNPHHAPTCLLPSDTFSPFQFDTINYVYHS